MALTMNRTLLSDSPDTSWEIHGRNEAYYGVLSDARFRASNLSESVLAEFMQSGEDHIAEIIGLSEHHFGALQQRKKALDFGCGVGRLVLPLARRFDSVAGIDVSQAMLNETKLNAQRAELDNVSLFQVVDGLIAAQEKFDFIHSVIVFQHIPTHLGERLVSQLTSVLAPGGVAAIHVLLQLRRPLWKKIGSALRRRVALLRIPANLINGRPWNEPMMQMNEYRLDRLFMILANQGVKRVLVERADSGTSLQAFLIFKK
jgi:SAM-dependent methyltransferase